MLFELSPIELGSKRAGAPPIPEGYTEVLIDRETYLGNPCFGEPTRNKSIAKHRQWFKDLDHDHRIKKELRSIARRIKKKKEKICLICWCFPKRCHGEVYVEYVKQRI